MKAKILERHGVCICALTGDEFPHNGSKAERAAAIDKVTAHQAKSLEEMSKRQPQLSERQHFFPTTIPHAETRSEQELKAKRIADAPKQPLGIPNPPVNPFEGAWNRKVERLGFAWGQSPAGRQSRAEVKKLSKEWEAKQQAVQQQADFERSILPVVEHAKTALDSVRRDPQASRLEVEQAEDRLKLAQSGDVAGYSATDKEWRQRQANALVSKAVEVDAQARQLQVQRDELLKAAYEPVAEATETKMVSVYYPEMYHDKAKAGKTILEPMPQ